MVRYSKLVATVVFLELLLCMLMGCACMTGSAHAEMLEFANKRLNFTLFYPPDFEVLPSDNALVGLALRHKGGGFPTFNVVIQPGAYTQISQPAYIQEKALLDSYRLVGRNDVLSLGSTLQSGPARTMFSAVLQYTVNGEAFITRVGIFPGQTQHYVLTYMDKQKDYHSRESLAEPMFSSFNFPLYTPPNAPAKGMNAMVWLVILLGALLLFGLVRAIKR